jgi:hypothetical protein
MAEQGAATTGDADDHRRRLFRLALLHVLPSVVFGLVALTGLRAVLAGGPALGVPWLIAGLGGTVGSVLLVLAALRAGHAGADPQTAARGGPQTAGRAAAETVERGGTGPQATGWGITVVGGARLLMLGTAVVAALVGVALAPTGQDRGLVIGVSLGLGVALALFALLTTTARGTIHGQRRAA